MTYLPSPPTSPLLSSTTEKVLCGSCDRALEYCTRCWSYDHGHGTLIRRRNLSSSSTSSVASTAAAAAAAYRMMVPSPTTSSSSLQNQEDDFYLYSAYF
ncbi:unnamed protein product [Absidia cylindrospora]